MLCYFILNDVSFQTRSFSKFIFLQKKKVLEKLKNRNKFAKLYVVKTVRVYFVYTQKMENFFLAPYKYVNGDHF